MGIFDSMSCNIGLVLNADPDNGRVYTPGQSISGFLWVSAKKEIDLRAVRIKFSGRERTHWTEQHGSGENVTESILSFDPLQ